MGEFDLDSLFRFFRANPWLAAVAVYVVASFLRAITRGVKGDSARPPGARPPERRAADADLQERVRSGFEQMMRERAAGRSAVARPAAAAATAAPPKRALRPAPKPAPAPKPVPLRPVVQAKALAPALPASLEARGRLIRRSALTAPASRARGLLSDRSSLRRAVLASEILGTPLALREPR